MIRQCVLAAVLSAAVSATACASGALPPRLLLPEAEGEALLPPGTLRGQVWMLEGDRFVPRPGATVRLVGTDRRVTADERGAYRFDGLPAGRCQITAEWPGARAGAVACRLPAAFGVDRVPLALAPPVGAAAGGVLLVGTLTDPRGAGLGAGTIHCVDSTGGNRKFTADAAGCFFGEVAGAAGGSASVMGYGVTPGGLHVEARALQAIALNDGPTHAVAVTTEVTEPLGEARVVPGGAGTLSWAATRLPARRDELAIRLPCADGDLAPSRLEGDRVTIAAPPGCPASPTGARLLPLGLD